MTDILMPGTSGLIVMSGLADHAHVAGPRPWTTFLQKPFVPAELVDAVRQAISRPVDAHVGAGRSGAS